MLKSKFYCTRSFADSKCNKLSLNHNWILSILVLLLSIPITCFSQAGCGSLANSFSPPLGDESAIRIYDRFGNEYSQESIQVPRVAPVLEGYGGCEDCNSGVMDIGIFRLFFMDIIEDTQHGFDEASPLCVNRKQVLCQVFNDLKNFLVISNSATPRVNIRIRKSGILNLSGTANQLAAASSFYLIPSGQMDGIIDGETWKSITGDEDPYNNYPPALLQQSAAAIPGNAGYFHGDIHFSFPENSEYYHTDFTTITPDNTHDMYTIALHEVMHMLGFTSLIGENGQSKVASCPECYSRYDSYLELNGQSILSQNPGPNDSCEEITFGGPNNMAVGCANGVIFNGDSNPNQDVFSPNSWLNSSSLSHFECSDDVNICPFQNSEYVMTWCNLGGPEFTRRHPSQEEANTFCDLGYRRLDTWGDVGNPLIFKTYTDCTGSACLPSPVAYNDYLNPLTGQPWIISSSNPPVPIISINVISNDFSSDGVACASIVGGGGTVELIPGFPNFIRYFTPTSAFVGYVIIKYKAYKNCLEGQILSNDAYVFIQIDLPPVCSEDDCNLICGGDFEETNFSATYSPFTIGDAGNTPDLYKRNPLTGLMTMLNLDGSFVPGLNLPAGCNPAVTIPEPYSPSSIAYIGFLARPHPSGSRREGILLNLNQPMLFGSQYKISFWARGSHEDCLPTIGIWGDDIPPCSPPAVTLLDGTISSCGFTATLLGSAALTDEWVKYTIDINPVEDINFIVIANTEPITIPTYTLLDDVVLNQDPSPINLSVSSTIDNPTPCTNGIVTINYNIELLPGQSTNPNPIDLQATLPPGFSIIAPSDFSGSGQHIIPSNTLQPGIPYQLTLTLKLNALTSGIPYEIALDITDNGSACYEASSSNSIVVITPSDGLLSINTYASNTFVASGDEVTVYIEVCNHSKDEITGIVVTDLLPPNLTFINSPDLTLNGGVLSSLPFNLLGIDKGLPPNCLTFSFKAKVEFASECSIFENCATATYPTCGDVTDCVQFVGTSNTDIELSNTTNLDPVLQPTGETGKSISIEGTFTVVGGTTYTFDGCDILMYPDAEIILEPNATLQLINGTHLYGCDDLWKSITVNEDATLIINSGSIIQDARRGIDVPATVATLSLNDCVFRNNYIGVFAHYGYNAIINGMIRNTTFECLNPIYEYNNQTFAGIYLHRTSIPNIRNCAFRNLNFGVYANSSPVQVSFCQFKNIQPYYAGVLSGTGVVSFTKGTEDLIVHGNYGQDPAFVECAGGVYSFNTHLQVLNLDMENVARGVEFKIIGAPVEYPTLIAKTNIKCSDYGIKGLVFAPEQNPLINSNFIEVSDTDQDGIASGIFVESDIVQSAVTINNNTVHVENGEFGIFIRNFLDATVVLNGSGNAPGATIQLNSPNATGIHIENTHFGFVGCNYVMNGSSMDNTTGINVVSSPSIEFNCNHVDQTATGFRVNGVCNTPENFKGTDFGDHNIGFQVAASGRLSDQTHQGNIWDGIDNLEAQNLGNPSLSSFIVDDDISDFIPNPIFPLNWFISQATNDSYACNQSPCPLPKPAPLIVVDDVDLLIAGGASSRPSSFSPQGLQWMSASYLYEKLKAFPDLISQNPLLGTFMDDYASSSAGALSALHQQTIQMAGFGSDTLDFLSQIADVNDTYSERLMEIDSLLNLAPSAPTVEALLSEQQTLLHNLRKNTWKTESLQTALNNLIAEKLDNLHLENSTVLAANILESNYQDVSRIWLESVGIGKPDLLYDNASELYDIAHQCPYEGGWAVYWARSLYSYIEPQRYDDDQLCDSSAQERMDKVSVVSNPMLNIKPNPANDIVNLSWTLGHTSEANLIITNVLQQPVFSAQTNASVISIDVKSFLSGVYYAFVIQDGKIMHSKPFIIAK